MPEITETSTETLVVDNIEALNKLNKVMAMKIAADGEGANVETWDYYRDLADLVVGEGKEKSRYLRYIPSEKLENVIIYPFLPKKDLFELYSICEAFIFPTNYDIYGHVVSEAMSQGLPVISTPFANSSLKLIKDDFNGYIIKEIRPEILTKKLNKILQYDFSKNAIDTARKNTIEISAQEHIKFIMEILTKWTYFF